MNYKLLDLPRQGMDDKRRKALSKLYSQLKNEIEDNYTYTVSKAELFNSGYQGMCFFVDDIRVQVFDDPGVCGAEDVTPGCIYSVINQTRTIIKKHKVTFFGDTEITDEERKEAYQTLFDVIMHQIARQKEMY